MTPHGELYLIFKKNVKKNNVLCPVEHNDAYAVTCYDGPWRQTMADTIYIDLFFDSAVVAAWSSCAQKGFSLPCRVGKTLDQLLVEQLGMDSNYVETVVRTVFHNSSPVDSLTEVTIADGDMVALAGAMPGLVGIAMGRNSPVGSFREDISSKPRKESKKVFGKVSIKGFNVVVPELVRFALAHGIVIDAAKAADLLRCSVESMNEDSRKMFERLQQSEGEIVLSVNWANG